MITVAFLLFALFVLLSAFFSSAETAMLTINRIRLAHRAKKQRKAQVLLQILEKPESFFSTILIGNNLVNVGAATVATWIFTEYFHSNSTLLLVLESLVTTIILLLFSEITPKSFAFHHAERLADLYARPLRLATILFAPMARITSYVSQTITRRPAHAPRAELSLAEIKHFLTHETQLLQHSPETLKMVNEIIDIAGRDIKSIMVPRNAVVALEESAGIDELKSLIVEKNYSKIPIYKGYPHNITGIVHPHSLLPALIRHGDHRGLKLRDVADPPIFVSEYSSLHYILAEFRHHKLNMAVILDEYGVAIGIITLSDILREIVGNVEIGSHNIRQIARNAYRIKGSTPVEEVNARLEADLPEKKDYTTLSGLFIYHFGRFPERHQRIRLGRCVLQVRQMGKRKIEEIVLAFHENHNR